MANSMGRIAIALLLVGFVFFFMYFTKSSTKTEDTQSESTIEFERSVIGGPTSGKPYSPAILTTRFQVGPEGQRQVIGSSLFVSGQIAIDPESGNEVRSDVAAETRQVLTNIKKWVEEAGFKLSDAVKCTVFLADIADYADMNSAYIEFFPENPPARECVAVKEIVKSFRVEISLTAEK